METNEETALVRTSIGLRLFLRAPGMGDCLPVKEQIPSLQSLKMSLRLWKNLDEISGIALDRGLA